MSPLRAYLLRVRLLAAGFVPIPCFPDGRPAVVLHTPPSESGVRSWATLYERATNTGIIINGRLAIVDEVPSTSQEPVELAELAKVQIAEENRIKEAIKNRERKRAKRRAQGIVPRSEWLAAHSAKPWIEAGMSRSTWYRRLKGGTGMAG